MFVLGNARVGVGRVGGWPGEAYCGMYSRRSYWQGKYVRAPGVGTSPQYTAQGNPTTLLFNIFFEGAGKDDKVNKGLQLI